MAYVRWGSKSDWYVFWESSPAQTKYDERLAIWHADVRDHQFVALYGKVRAMLDAGERSPASACKSHASTGPRLYCFATEGAGLAVDPGPFVGHGRPRGPI
jgi:hypothetical protein